MQVGRQALTEEIAVIDRFYARRVLIAPCLDRRLAEDAARIRDLGAGRKLTPQAASPAARAPGALLSDADWQSERSSQTLTHFPRAELALKPRRPLQTDVAEGSYVVAPNDDPGDAG